MECDDVLDLVTISLNGTKRRPSLLVLSAKLLKVGGHSRIRTYDFHRVKVALYR